MTIQILNFNGTKLTSLDCAFFPTDLHVDLIMAQAENLCYDNQFFKKKNENLKAKNYNIPIQEIIESTNSKRFSLSNLKDALRILANQTQREKRRVEKEEKEKKSKFFLQERRAKNKQANEVNS